MYRSSSAGTKGNSITPLSVDDVGVVVGASGFGVGVAVAVGLGVLVAEPEPEPEPEPLPESVAAVVVVVVVSPSGLTITSPSSVVTEGSVSDSVVVASVVVSEDVEVSVGTRTSFFLLQPWMISATTSMRTRTPPMIESVIVNCFLSM